MTTVPNEVRKQLVLAAEAAVEKLFKGQVGMNHSQLSKLSNICGEATCAAEIENYLRYQMARPNVWDRRFGEDVIDRARGALSALEDENDEEQVAAWQHYATYLARSFRYHKELAKGGNGHG